VAWAIVAIVALGLVAALLYLYLVPWNRTARYGSVEVPSDTVIQLPAGELIVYYEDAERWKRAERPQPAQGFSVVISDEQGGERIDQRPPPRDTAVKARGRNRIPHAALTLPTAGRYRVRSQVNAGAAEPRITFG
jgi:hypothetical protein